MNKEVLNSNGSSIDEESLLKIKAASFDRLVEHLQKNTDVQNIDLMILADFCRNCLSKWYASAAATENIEIDYEQARNVIYGMPYSEWKEKHQLPATEEQLEAMKNRKN